MAETLQPETVSVSVESLKVVHLAAVVVQKAVTTMYHRAPDFGPRGIGRLPNDLDGYPDPVNPLEWHEDFSVYVEGEYPAYIIAGREPIHEVAC